MRTVWISAAIAIAGCTAGPQRPVPGQIIPAGQWGGEQIALDVAADGSGRIEMSCASAEFNGPVSLDSGGHFLTAGRFAAGTGVAMKDAPPPVPANISGRLDPGGILWLDIALAGSYPVRNARLKRGATPNLLRCL